MSWSGFALTKKFKISLALSVLYLLFLTAISPFLFLIIQKRQGFVPPDPLLALFPPTDVSDEIFFTLYLFIILTVIYVIRKPRLLLFALQAYGLMMTMRFITLFLVPLDAPPGIVTLRDPMARIFFYEDGGITKDLFFSGHAATLFLFFFIVENVALKYSILIGAIVLSVLLLTIHTHYSYDVLAAPLFAYAAYKITGKVFGSPAYVDPKLK